MTPTLYADTLGAHIDRRHLETKRVDPPPHCDTLAELFLWQRQIPASHGRDAVVAPAAHELELIMRQAGPLRVITPYGNLIIYYGEPEDG